VKYYYINYKMSLRFLAGSAAAPAASTKEVAYYPSPYKFTKKFVEYKNLVDF
jgi:hypothetical protein